MNPIRFHEESHVTIGGLLREVVFGFNDGLVSTFAIIAGLTGGLVENKTILLGALATLFAGAFSMGLGTYLGNKSEREIYESELAREKYEIKTVPELERQEIRDIYAEKGFKGKLLEDIVAKITSDEKLWLETMMREELGFAEKPPNPIKNAVYMSIAFTFGAFIPTVPFLFEGAATNLFLVSSGLSIVALLGAGAYKTRFTKKNVAWSAFETLLVGVIAASGTYGIGALIGG
ncbi:iron transporter [Candidatus Peregrinibacteria bacterium CG11_big_fil_rev_8_21_14_0_20_46_8]|nr:MAG: iron transporter [Candidatus Peregrinibacteria bacterium CG11_big_fil_rev_8_21_14_0_20_46_8]